MMSKFHIFELSLKGKTKLYYDHSAVHKQYDCGSGHKTFNLYHTTKFKVTLRPRVLHEFMFFNY